MMKTLLSLTLVVFLLVIPTPSQAGIYKCIDASGGITYSQQECPHEQKTAKVLSSRGVASKQTDCSIAGPFISAIANAMYEGRSSGETFAHYGGMDNLSKQALGLINYIYTYKGNDTVLPSRIQSLTNTKCRAGSFGAMTCSILPQIFLNEQGGCEPRPGNQTANGNNERSESRTAERED